MSVRHRGKNRLVPPPDFVELHERSAGSEQHRAAAAVFLTGRSGTCSAPPPCAPSAPPSTTPASGDGKEQPLPGGLGVVRLPVDGLVRGTLLSSRQRHVFHASTAARIWAYYESMPEAGKTKRLVPPSVGQRPSVFNTPLLREVLKFALSAGCRGLTEMDQMAYISVLLMVEQGGRARRPFDRRHNPRPRQEQPLVGAVCVDHLPHTDDVSDGDSSDDGELARAFPTHHSFVAALRGEQRRVLSKLGWEETPLVVEGVSFVFYSRDLLSTVLDLLKNAGHLQLWGEQLGIGSDGTRLRAEMMDSDVFLTEEASFRRLHGLLSFVLGVQLFIEEAVVSWSGAHYMYPIRARVVNIRDRAVHWVTVGHIPHVGKPVARTAAARRRASDTRNAVLQRCLAILLRRFVGASRSGVSVEFPGRQKLTAMPRIVGLVADQLGERSVVCLMGNGCEFFCSHCMVRRAVAGGRAGLGAPWRDVTSVLDAQLEGAITRDRDPRPSLRKQLGVEHSALAFVPVLGAVWGLATDNKQLFDVISFDLLRVWKLVVVRMVAQRFPSFLRVACAGKNARLGPVPETLEALNLRAWEMGHLCVPSPTPPGYVTFAFCWFPCHMGGTYLVVWWHHACCM